VKHLAQFSVGTTLKSGSIFGRRQHFRLKEAAQRLAIKAQAD
jgi:hypothetical protein